jgi:ABC-2 type transport system permease protein
MGKLLAIAGRELRAYFASPLAYIIAALFMLVAGYLFSLILFASRQADLRPLFQNLAVVFLLITPALTMRLIADERSRSTFEMLMTRPISDTQIVLGKFLGALGYLAFLVLLTAVFPLILILVKANPDWMPMLSGYLGTFLLGASFMAVGILASSWTANVAVAAIATFAISLVIWLLPSASSIVGQQASGVLEYLSVISHQDSLGRGVIDTSDILFYATFIGTCLYLTVRSINVSRWR